jgi:NitT/TauT family transport system permease protein
MADDLAEAVLTATNPVQAELLTGLTGLDNLDLAGGPGRRRPEKIWGALWPKLLALAIVLGIWEVVYLSGWKPHDIFPGPAQVFPNLWGQAQHGLLWQAIGTTVRRAAVGFGLALIIGSVVGALVSRIPPLRAGVGSLITGLQIMPSIAWFPFAIIFFGLNNAAILFVVVLGAAPSIANGLIAGVDYTPPLLLRVGKTMGLRRIALYRHLILPASLPTYVAGLKQGWAFAYRSLMAGELLVIIANTSSIGVLLNNDQDQTDMPSTISIMIVILMLGIGVDALFNLANGRIRRRWGLADPAQTG